MNIHFFIKNENKRLIGGASSRRSKSRNNQNDQSDTSVRSPRNDDDNEENVTSRQPSASSLKGLLKTEIESQSPQNKIINKPTKKLDLIKKLENDLNDQEEQEEEEEEEKGQINKAYESDTNQTKEKEEEKTKKSRKREPKNKIPRGI